MTTEPGPAHLLAAARSYLVAEDVDLIQSLVPLGEPIVVDLGSGSGTTALAVLDANPRARVFSTDHLVANRNWSEANVRPHHPDARVEWNVSTVLQYAAQWRQAERDPVDLLLHDAGHGYFDVFEDLRAWLPLVRPEGWVWIHDYTAPPPDWGAVDDSEGVRRAVRDLMRDHLLDNQLIPRGLGVAGRVLNGAHR